MACMSQLNAPYRLGDTIKELPAICTQSNGVTKPAFLGEDYVCTDLPTHITLVNMREIEKRRLKEPLQPEAASGGDVLGSRLEGPYDQEQSAVHVHMRSVSRRLPGET